jgi:hypothetical protein
VWSSAVASWLRKESLIPIAVELDVAWHRIETSSRIDMLCVDDRHAGSTILPPVVVVSIKTIGENEHAPAMKHGARALRLPKNVFGDKQVADCEYSRHQLQLMLECVTLADSYKCIVQDAHVIYVNYSGNGDRAKVRVEEHTADKWWFKRLIMNEDAENLSEALYALSIYMNSQYDFSKPPNQ